MTWLAAALVAVAGFVAWAVHDIASTWERSLRLPEAEDD